ncbi:DM13 domain-containing protein [Merismopedia glauca]|uniref:Electron transfer flavoprotein n=1 Tax=Merismopedia glauca CCAP 1448/3 TaxID=1296344 RepID=A0A2T1C465_9CYAN|nr:DM13 domain-containing protein [Merismopedia glauca]PSB03046.1 electron transfer flavoprotein [Merismopedia glauca CCAP 1448/3]
MKLASALVAIAFCLVACQAQSDTQTPLGTSSPVASTSTKSQNQGAFIGQGHSTTGNTKIVTENGQKYLLLDSGFSTDNGPDLFVILHKSVPPQDYDAKNYVNLGKLEKTSGSQKYSIPANINPQDFRSVAIWCRQFNVTFGYAPLAK